MARRHVISKMCRYASVHPASSTAMTNLRFSCPFKFLHQDIDLLAFN